MFQETVGRDLADADRNKYRYYQAFTIVPVSMSARGAMGRHTLSLIDNLCNHAADWDFSERVRFRSGLLSRLSVILLRSAHAMKVVRSARAQDGV